MISADDARNLLKESTGVAACLERIEKEIKTACEEGKSKVEITIVPEEFRDTVEYILEKEGYAVCYNRYTQQFEIGW